MGKRSVEIIVDNEVIAVPRKMVRKTRNGVMYYKGDVGKMFANQRLEDVYNTHPAVSSNSGGISLRKLINAQMVHWGWNSSGEMEQLAEAMIGSPDECYDEDEYNSAENWWNERGY